MTRCRKERPEDTCPTIQPSKVCSLPDDPIIPEIPGEDDDEVEISSWVWWIVIILVIIIMVSLIAWSVRNKRMANGVQKWGWMAISVLFLITLMMFAFGLFYDDGDVVVINPAIIPEGPYESVGKFPVIYPADSGMSSSKSQGDVFFDFNGQSFDDGPSCNLNISSRWNNDKCSCIPPFYGNCCSREAYSDKYFEAGTIDTDNMSDVRYKVLRKTRADRLSFPFEGIDCDQKTCTGQCDKDKYCTGVIWKGAKQCTLIQGNVYLNTPDDIVWDRNVDSNLFLKNSSNCSRRKLSGRDIGYTKRLKIPDTVWVWKECLPTRYYLSDISESNGICTVSPLNLNTPRQLNFNPEGSANQGDLIGVYTTYRIDKSEAQKLLCKQRSKSGCDELWIDRPGKSFPKIPVVDSLWAIYIDSQTCN